MLLSPKPTDCVLDVKRLQVLASVVELGSGGQRHPEPDADVRMILLGKTVAHRRVLVARRVDRADSAAERAFHAVLVETAAIYRGL